MQDNLTAEPQLQCSSDQHSGTNQSEFKPVQILTIKMTKIQITKLVL